jgi:GMP synthase (glutamine-hydrolysing)
MAHLLGGKVSTAPVSEYGKTEVTVDSSSLLFEGVFEKTICWMSHTDYIEKARKVFLVTHLLRYAGSSMENRDKALCSSVSPGSYAYRSGLYNATEFCI